MAKLVLDMPEAEYHALDSLSSTGARRLIAPGCPALFDYERRHPRTPTPAMRLGRAAHRPVMSRCKKNAGRQRFRHIPETRRCHDPLSTGEAAGRPAP